MRPFLKWPGGKYRLVRRIRAALRPGKRLIEPFTGSAAVFLNTDYANYVLADSNNDLIALYRQLVEEGEPFVDYCRTLFVARNNSQDRFYALRNEFNATREPRRRAALFLYLNRHCYNGLCRYNRGGKFNTPFGRYLRPYFPAAEMRAFILAARRARFVHAGFRETMRTARRGDVVYCDPPYVPLSRTAYFTDYDAHSFGWPEQEKLAEMARQLARRGVQVVISNHDTEAIRRLYQAADARIEQFRVQRNISCNGTRRDRVGELLAIFG
ncbi:MAG: Dam family site-specific DNA-(adenine-N6)-methyltransferase [Gammaproteobacteria bacterium]|nr:Dam family site-specific DNA-(adenine-N6)-methyltransferase [Gammaproteobacteria bacterium]